MVFEVGKNFQRCQSIQIYGKEFEIRRCPPTVRITSDNFTATYLQLQILRFKSMDLSYEEIGQKLKRKHTTIVNQAGNLLRDNSALTGNLTSIARLTGLALSYELLYPLTIEGLRSYF